MSSFTKEKLQELATELVQRIGKVDPSVKVNIRPHQGAHLVTVTTDTSGIDKYLVYNDSIGPTFVRIMGV